MSTAKLPENTQVYLVGGAVRDRLLGLQAGDRDYVVVGASVEESTILAILLENACEIQLLADAARADGAEFDRACIERLHDTITKTEQYTINFEYLRRRAIRQKD